MANKENKGGVLTNDQIEQDLKVGGKDHQQEHYHGTKDPGLISHKIYVQASKRKSRIKKMIRNRI
jgi:hypothetical protein